MKRFLLVPLIILLVGVLIFGSCAKTAPAPVPTLTSTPKPAQTPAEPIKLKFSHGVPVQSVFHKSVFVPWTEMIKERTTAIGKPVEINIYGAEAFGKLNDQYDLVVNGAADITGCWGPFMYPGRFHLSRVMELPFIFPNAEVAGLVEMQLFYKWPEFRDEFAETKTLAFQPTAGMQILTRAKQIKTLEDFKGLKVNSKGGVIDELMKALRAVPVTMMQTEVYDALQRGLLDVAVIEWEGAFIFKWYEVTKYRTALPRGLYNTNLVMSMNWGSWNKLPPDVQRIFDELSGDYLTKLAVKSFDKANMHLFEVIVEHDLKLGNPEVYYLPDKEFEKWVGASAPIYKNWVNEMEAMGLPGEAVCEDVQNLVKKYSP